MSKKNFKVWSKKAAEKASDDQLFFKLVAESSGVIALHVVNKKGERVQQGTLLHFLNDHGVFVMRPNLSDEFQIRVDLMGHAETYTLKQMYEFQKFSDAEDNNMCKSSSHTHAFKMPSEFSDKLKEAIIQAIKEK